MIIGNRKFKDIDEIDLNTFDTINDCYRFRASFMEQYKRIVAGYFYSNCRGEKIDVDCGGISYVGRITRNTKVKLLENKIQDIYGIEGLNGYLIRYLNKFKNILYGSDLDEYAKHFGIEGKLFDIDLEKYINGNN